MLSTYFIDKLIVHLSASSLNSLVVKHIFFCRSNKMMCNNKVSGALSIIYGGQWGRVKLYPQTALTYHITAIPWKQTFAKIDDLFSSWKQSLTPHPPHSTVPCSQTKPNCIKYGRKSCESVVHIWIVKCLDFHVGTEIPLPH